VLMQTSGNPSRFGSFLSGQYYCRDLRNSNPQVLMHD
jgi:hypothetical protein